MGMVIPLNCTSLEVLMERGPLHNIRFEDLNGSRPPLHPDTIKRNKDGTPVVALYQTWVSRLNGTLWFVYNIDCPENYCGRKRIHLVSYGYRGKISHQKLSKEALLANMRIWDDENILRIKLSMEVSILPQQPIAAMVSNKIFVDDSLLESESHHHTFDYE